MGDEAFLSRKLFSDAVSKLQPSQKLGIQRLGPFKISKLIGENAIRLELPSNIKIHQVVYVKHTSRCRLQPHNIALKQQPPTQPFIHEHGDTVIEVSKHLSNRKRGRGLQFRTINKGAPIHEPEWKPRLDTVLQF